MDKKPRLNLNSQCAKAVSSSDTSSSSTSSRKGIVYAFDCGCLEVYVLTRNLIFQMVVAESSGRAIHLVPKRTIHPISKPTVVANLDQMPTLINAIEIPVPTMDNASRTTTTTMGLLLVQPATAPD